VDFQRREASEIIAGVLLLAFVLVATPQARAGDPRLRVAQREATKMRKVLSENFQAINEENLKKLIGTTSRFTGTPQEMAEFAAEAEQMFKDTDVYMRLVDFQLTDFSPPFADAQVTQLTLPAEDKDTQDARPGKAMGRLEFRDKSALLPEFELCTYKQRFHFENGKWKVHRVLSQPVKAERPSEAK
jgi:hypothetical protein